VFPFRPPPLEAKRARPLYNLSRPTCPSKPAREQESERPQIHRRFTFIPVDCWQTADVGVVAPVMRGLLHVAFYKRTRISQGQTSPPLHATARRRPCLANFLLRRGAFRAKLPSTNMLAVPVRKSTFARGGARSPAIL
jgi:hypothetical protein